MERIFAPIFVEFLQWVKSEGYTPYAGDWMAPNGAYRTEIEIFLEYLDSKK